MRILWILLTILISPTWVGCGSSQPTESNVAPLNPKAPPLDETITNVSENPFELNKNLQSEKMSSTSPPVEKFVALSKRDLASRLGIEAGKISLVKSTEMLWLNAALGCPRPGVVYPQGRVPGFQIWLEVEGNEYIYNTDFNGTVVLCPELNPDVPNLDTGPTPGVPIR